MQVICTTVHVALWLEITKVKNKHIPRLCFSLSKHNAGESDFLGNISCLKTYYHWYFLYLKPSVLTWQSKNKHLSCIEKHRIKNKKKCQKQDEIQTPQCKQLWMKSRFSFTEFLTNLTQQFLASFLFLLIKHLINMKEIVHIWSAVICFNQRLGYLEIILDLIMAVNSLPTLSTFTRLHYHIIIH